VCSESLHSSCHGADNSKPIITSLPSNEQQTLILLLLRAFRGFYGMGETRYDTNGEMHRMQRNTLPELYKKKELVQ
jgi:hypothetical protein